MVDDIDKIMFENFRKKRTTKMFMEDIDCVRLFLQEDIMRMEVLEDTFVFHIMKNMNVKMLEVGKKFYVFRNDVPDITDYLNNVEKLLRSNADINEIMQRVAENRV